MCGVEYWFVQPECQRFRGWTQVDIVHDLISDPTLQVHVLTPPYKCSHLFTFLSHIKFKCTSYVIYRYLIAHVFSFYL